MIGIDFNPKSQLELLNQFQKFKKEYNQIPSKNTGIEQVSFQQLGF